MATRCAIGRLPRIGALAGVFLTAALLAASEPIKGVREFNSQDQTVELFSAAEAGLLEARLVPRNSTECRLLIANKSDRPLNVRLPEALAGVPVLAQNFNDFPNFDGPNESPNAPQRLGIGNPFGVEGSNSRSPFNAPGGRNGGNQPFFAPFNIAPEKVAQLRLTSMCLDPGKPDPKPAMRYELRPLESVTEEPGVRELCAMVGRGELSQRAAQAAAWHLHNHLSWDELRAKRFHVAFGQTHPYFTRRQLETAQQAAETALEQAGAAKKKRSQDSLTMN